MRVCIGRIRHGLVRCHIRWPQRSSNNALLPKRVYRRRVKGIYLDTCELGQTTTTSTAYGTQHPSNQDGRWIRGVPKGWHSFSDRFSIVFVPYLIPREACGTHWRWGNVGPGKHSPDRLLGAKCANEDWHYLRRSSAMSNTRLTIACCLTRTGGIVQTFGVSMAGRNRQLQSILCEALCTGTVACHLFRVLPQ